VIGTIEPGVVEMHSHRFDPSAVEGLPRGLSTVRLVIDHTKVDMLTDLTILHIDIRAT